MVVAHDDALGSGFLGPTHGVKVAHEALAGLEHHEVIHLVVAGACIHRQLAHMFITDQVQPLSHSPIAPRRPAVPN
jgi:hypothetical protein